MRKNHYFVKLAIAVVGLLGLALITGCTGGTGPAGGPDIGNPSPAGVPSVSQPYVPDEVLVKFDGRIAATARDALIARLGAAKADEIEGADTLVLKVPQGQVESKVREFAAQQGVVYAEPNYTREATVLPNDTYFGLQWGENNTGQSSSNCFAAGTADADIDAPEAWDITTGSFSTRIAILDTGIQANHPDLKGKVVLAKSFVAGNTNDGNGHGSNTAGIAAAKSNNATGVAGTCWLCALMNGKILNNAGYGSASSSSNGIRWAADNGAKVISMSYGSSGYSQTEQDAVNYAWGKGAVLVAAAGNSNSSSFFYPAHYANVIAVAATDNNDAKASFSNYGTWVHVAAPGVCIASTYKGSGYVYMSGTSQATPFVSGLAGLVWSTPYGTSNSAVVSRIETTADPIGAPTYWQYGRINAYKAVQ